MKKIISIVLVLGILAGTFALYAETASQDFTVQSVNGKVEREVSAGKWEAVTKDMKLAPSAVVNTGLNSNLVLKQGDKIITIKAMQKGTVEKLTSAIASKKAGIKIGAKAAESNAAEDVGPGRTNVSTASTRASDATEDLEWEE